MRTILRFTIHGPRDPAKSQCDRQKLKEADLVQLNVELTNYNAMGCLAAGNTEASLLVLQRQPTESGKSEEWSKRPCPMPTKRSNSW